MIKLRDLICEILSERMSYADLMKHSDPVRADKASRIPAKSLAVKSLNDREAWKFSFKSTGNESTTGQRHQGFIYFFKESMEPGDNAMTIPCSVDCSCPDYKYRFSYANAANGAGETGPTSLNRATNSPSIINQGPGLCKHLISLKEYLKTNIEAEPISADEPPTAVSPPVAIPTTPPPEKTPPEEPEEEEPTPPTDPTQTPQPDTEHEPTDTPSVADPTQTPNGPEVADDEIPEPTVGEPIQNPEENPVNKKLKETTDTSRLTKSLDEFCKRNRVFIV